MHKYITDSAEKFNVKKEDFINKAIKRPAYFSSKPETLYRKAKIRQYYKELKNKPTQNLLECLRIEAEKHLLAQVLGILIKQQTGKSFTFSSNPKDSNLKDFLKNNPDEYNLKIPNREIITESLIRYAESLEKELDNKVKFNFKIVEE